MTNLFVARQPVFDRDGRVWGYKLLYRAAMEDQSAEISDEDEASIKVASYLSISPDRKGKKARNIINASRDFILRGFVGYLASDTLVVSLPAGLYADPEIRKELEETRNEGVRVAIVVDREFKYLNRFIDQADIVEIPVTALGKLDPGACPTGSAGKPMFLVTRIETWEEACRALDGGADLLQGFYFCSPANYSRGPMPPTLTNGLRVLQILESEKQDIGELTRAVESDPGLSLKLISFVNSAAFSLLREVDSVRHAIALVGWKRLKNWLHLMVVVDCLPSDKTRELAYCSAMRGKFLELLALYSGRHDLADSLYLTGLFSLLDVMLERSFGDIFKELAMDSRIKEALAEESGEIRPWLELAIQLDSENWLLIDSLAMDLGLDLLTISRCRLESLEWVNRFVPDMQG
ncbi:MAG: HDOD domain-containing protein [Desulfovibrionales bacterium]